MSQGGRVVVVAQAFKESLSLAEVAAALERATRATGLEPVVIKGSDGGDGLLDAMENDLRQRTTHRVSGPAARQVDVEAGWLDPTTVLVESRLACGLSLLAPGERDPRRTTTRGVGELLVAVEAAGARQMVVGLGGSATMDGGTGMARAWGWEFLDEHGRPLGEGGGDLERLARILPGRSPAAGLTALVDVRHPLTGPEGAVIFAEQKGASPDAARTLARGLERLATVMGPRGEALAGRPGSGAAGGLGFGLMAFAGAELTSGADWMLMRRGFNDLLPGAVAVLVAEGRFDATSLRGKLAGEALARAEAAGVPGVLVAPTVTVRPPAAVVESGGGHWDGTLLQRHAEAALRRLSPS